MGTPHYPSMRIVRKDLIPNGPRSVKMIPVDSDDLWFAYNLVAGKDPFLAITLRKVVRQTKSGGKDAEWVKLKSEIWWPSLSGKLYDKEGSIKNILENEYDTSREVLYASSVMNMIKDTKAAQEVQVLKEFFNMISNDPTRPCCG
ncbi:protein PELOTA 1 [Citrus sinensis]|nr:protein PELOTA 1 [Citrus sinensis]